MLQLHRSERADRLIESLGDLLSAPLADPIAAEVVAVPTRGVERWLTQRLSHRLGAPAGGGSGVCANISFPFPGVLVGRAITAASDVDRRDDPWRPERSVWPLVELIDRHAEDERLAPLAAHLRAVTPADLQGRPGPSRRFATARHLADLFDRYSVHRPDLLIGWAAGEVGDDPTAVWQAYLWGLLRDRIGTPSPAERYADAARRLAAEPDLLDLPERVSLFGLTRLPASQLEVLQAIAGHRDVHLFLLHPSAALWDAVASDAPDPPAGLARSADPTSRLAGHPLLRSWGRDAREMQLVLAARGVTGGEHRAGPGVASDRLLARLQSDVRADRPPPGAPTEGEEDRRPALDADDRSLQVHACHGRARQVEVLRDAILHVLAADPTLEPRDVIVMCPDIETFAPLIHAAFGPDDPAGPDRPDRLDETHGSGLPRVRVRLADRAVRQTNPLLSVAAQLLALAGSRLTASEVMDLASRPPVSRRFRFDQDDLSTLQEWVAETGVRWGLDAEHRRPWALDRVAANTWASGLDRLLLGVTMAEGDGRTFAGVLPYDDVPSSAVDLAGRVAEMLQRLAVGLDRLQGPQAVGAWVDAVVTATEMLAVSAPGDGWQHEQLRRVMAEVGEQAVEAGNAGPELSLPEARDLLDSRLQGQPTRANFRTGDLTICTLVPMRSVPHRVVALLGLDDGAFPRHPEVDGDDLLLASPRVGDRDARSEDRQLLLDALLAATDHVLITYSGRDERTNRVRPPAVPVAELLDVVDAMVRPEPDRSGREQVVVHHPLQPFDARNFTAGKLVVAQPWSYDRVHLAGARAALDQRPPRPWLAGPLPPLDEPVLQLDDLVRFVEHPVRAFLRRRLGLYVSDRTDQLVDALPIDLDALEKWGVGDRLLQARLAGDDRHRATAAERARGLLPPGELAGAVLADVEGEVERLAEVVAALGFAPGPADSLDVHVELPDGRSLIGTVPGWRSPTVLACTYSRLAAKHRLGAWVRFLAVSAARPELNADVVTVGRGAWHQPPRVARLGPLAPTSEERQARALAGLELVIDLYGRGMREPLPLACATSGAWAAAAHRGAGEDAAYREAGDEWKGGLFPGEMSDAEHRYVWGPGLGLDELMLETVGDDEAGPGWDGADTRRFVVLSRRLWDPVLEHEEVGRT